jgi:hypothetical protein
VPSKTGTDPTKPRRRGRPTKYSRKLAMKICRRIATSKDALTEILETAGMPSYSTVMLWKQIYPDFSDMYARAREDQADFIADETLQIADSATPDDVNVARLRVDARKWKAAKMRPKVYGEKVTQEVKQEITGKDGGPVKIEHAGKPPEEMTDAELDAEIAALERARAGEAPAA